MLRQQNVATKRQDRSVPMRKSGNGLGSRSRPEFASDRGEGPAYRVSTVKDGDGNDLATLTYADTATLWRINMGWTRRENKDQHGPCSISSVASGARTASSKMRIPKIQ
ncbi:MAG: hypothetical protein R3A46_12655 [Thermomicrobiales bacterium]